ncbi:diacylglycerol kinase [Comamonas terrigena]|jgi:diacylglycerol kinase (ATP)|uniref:diacylglycerol kinase n=1 Tax=Comamonas terrigena TaxID=32013 RepID=UPI002447935F|nr:diacylglycerol kinase [Comamonas terrigena]MDH0051377.1 diacylglycerol kinase [Comamonas terrigena]MDH0513789.1 diacylglycerol kinase [Comamonas terrigena]MDH1093326.1 diacylglycerol kinase [Comamonas terrigena]MDH1293384.1 diacylglycerol kinase [Comamonas terrigena]MDH1503294.1 diacylglycerol kinase [Comamonas terrigena]
MNINKIHWENLTPINHWPTSVVAHKGVEKLIAVFILSAILIFIALISNKIQRNRRIEVVTFFLSIPLALLIGEGVVEKLILVSSVCFIIFIEITNSAIEAAIDRVLPKEHELYAKVKYLASATVFIIIFLSGTMLAIIGFENILLDRDII